MKTLKLLTVAVFLLYFSFAFIGCVWNDEEGDYVQIVSLDLGGKIESKTTIVYRSEKALDYVTSMDESNTYWKPGLYNLAYDKSEFKKIWEALGDIDSRKNYTILDYNTPYAINSKQYNTEYISEFLKLLVSKSSDIGNNSENDWEVFNSLLQIRQKMEREIWLHGIWYSEYLSLKEGRTLESDYENGKAVTLAQLTKELEKVFQKKVYFEHVNSEEGDQHNLFAPNVVVTRKTINQYSKDLGSEDINLGGIVYNGNCCGLNEYGNSILRNDFQGTYFDLDIDVSDSYESNVISYNLVSNGTMPLSGGSEWIAVEGSFKTTSGKQLSETERKALEDNKYSFLKSGKFKYDPGQLVTKEEFDENVFPNNKAESVFGTFRFESDGSKHQIILEITTALNEKIKQNFVCTLNSERTEMTIAYVDENGKSFSGKLKKIKGITVDEFYKK